MMSLVGNKYGRLEVKKKLNKKNGRHQKWLCKCECGNKTEVQENNLKSGHTKSCGCLNREVAIESNTTHGMSDTRFYQIWRDMKDRTSRKKNSAYERYGGRGISVCKRWNKFENFMSDMYKSYKKHSKKHGEKNTTIDRIDNDGDYNFDNCRWATYKKQALNRRNRREFDVKGEKLSVREIANKFDLTRSAVNHRIARGWTVEEIISTPLGGRR